MKHRVKQFGRCTGTLPEDGEIGKEELIEGLFPLILKIKEEVEEFEEAVINEDIKEVLDARTDLQYYLDQITIWLEAVGVNIELAEELVSNNNDEKYSSSYDFVEAKYLEWGQTDHWFASRLRIDGNISDGVTYFCLKDTANKVRKFVDHPKVDLLPCLPKELL